VPDARHIRIGAVVTWAIRRLEAGEVDQSRALRLAALADAPEMFEATYEEEASEPEEFWRERACRGANSEDVATFVATAGTRHIGTATGLLTDGAPTARLVAMWVEPPARGTGVGQALVAEVCNWAALRGATSIELEVREHNHTARRLYERAGFAAAVPSRAASKCELQMARPLVSPIVARIQRDTHAPQLFDILAHQLAGTDLQSLLLEVFRKRSTQRSPTELLAQRVRDPTLLPAPLDARRLHEIEGLALDAAVGFEAVALSPVAPRALNTVLGAIDQNNSLATIRGSEVLADPTTALALEAALRRRAGVSAIRLCSTDRVLRLQPFPDGLNQHFGLFSLVTSGRAMADHRFELDALRDHVETHLRFLTTLRDRRYDIASIAVEVCDPREQLVESHVYARLRTSFPDVTFRFNPERKRALTYYDGLLLEVVVHTATGKTFSVIDGGLADWTQRLLANRKERLFVSACGLELLARYLAPAVRT
jgi:GNAT superfamily N-acetyltransferase